MPLTVSVCFNVFFNVFNVEMAKNLIFFYMVCFVCMCWIRESISNIWIKNIHTHFFCSLVHIHTVRWCCVIFILFCVWLIQRFFFLIWCKYVIYGLLFFGNGQLCVQLEIWFAFLFTKGNTILKWKFCFILFLISYFIRAHKHLIERKRKWIFL